MMDQESSAPVGFWRPFLVVSCVLPVHFLFGTTLGQTAGMLPQLLEKDSFIKITEDQSTWIASSATIGTFFASCLTGRLSDAFGRIRLGQTSCFFFGVGYAMMLGANSFILLVVGRFLTGLGIGCGVSANIYISEMSPPFWRGVFLSFIAFITSVGVLYMYAVGVYLPWNIAAGTAFLISIFGLILTLFIYDSPVWLVRKNKIETARKSLKQIEGSKHVDARLKQIQEIADSRQETKLTLKIFFEPTVWKPFAMIMIMSLLQSASGFFIVVFYTVLFFREFHSAYDPPSISIMVGLARLLSMGITSYLHGIIGRRPIGAISGFSCALNLTLIFIYLKIEKGIPFLHDNSWIPIGLFLLYMITMSLGIFPLPFAMPFEVYPIKVRGVMCGISYSSIYVFQFVSVKSYDILMDNLGLEGVIMVFAVGSFLFGVFSVTMMVETHDKTLEEIEDIFSGRKRRLKGEGERGVSSGDLTASDSLPRI